MANAKAILERAWAQRRELLKDRREPQCVRLGEEDYYTLCKEYRPHTDGLVFGAWFAQDASGVSLWGIPIQRVPIAHVVSVV